MADTPGPTGAAPLTGEEPLNYRPLSLAAVAGFCLAAAYALFVAGGGALSFFERAPWLTPASWFVLPLPVLAVVLCLLARQQIAASEGTLSGIAFTRWGLGLAVGVGLCYGAYFLATRLAVSQQAQGFTRNWLEDMRNGKSEEAFWLTTPPPRSDRPPGRDTLETRYNAPPDAGRPGALSDFLGSDYVRLLEAGGTSAEIEYLGLRDWDFKQGGYEVVLDYEIRTPLAILPLVVTVRGVHSPTGEFSGRQWFVVRNQTGRPRDRTLELTDAGKADIALAARAEEFAVQWGEALNGGRLLEAYRLTLPPAQRAAASKEDAAWTRFVTGGLVDADPKVFWADPEQREPIVKSARALFCQPPPRPSHVSVDPVVTQRGGLRTCKHSDGTVQVDCDAHLILMREGVPPGPPFLVEATIHVVAEEGPAQTDPQAWRVSHLILRNGRTQSGGQPARR